LEIIMGSHEDAGAGTEDGTRERLLEAAGEEFAEHGYRMATIREICRRAKVNIAAVNYHFRDKEGLYAEVLKYAHRHALETYPPSPPSGETLMPEQRLRIFVHSLVKRTLDRGRPAWHGKLMAREIVEPTRALEDLVGQSIRPMHDLLLGIVRELAGPEIPETRLRLCVTSVVGQCLHFYLARPVILHLDPFFKYEEEQIEALANHVTDFSIAAIKGLRRGGTDS
jgi:TetR/AcrR family transcriptional regulator, regulator of cefoperazone and chloramphenicol sensitivity